MLLEPSQNDIAAQAPATSAVEITPSDVTTYDPALRAIYVGTEGDLVVQLASDETTVTLKAVPAGSIIPLRAVLIGASSTAADIVGFR